MAITTSQYEAILSRLGRLEDVLNDTFVAIDKFITTAQMNQLLTITQQDIDDLRTQTDALEARVTGIENEPMS